MTLPNSMDFITSDGAGEPDVLRLSSGPLPAYQPGEVLIRVLAAGVNRPDIQQRKGVYPPPPGASPIIGLEVAGTIAAIGDDVTSYKVGDRVCALTNGGGYAEYCAAPAGQCLPWPEGYDAIRAAAVPENYFTVWANVFMMGRLHPGEDVLVHGGTSGIGLTTIHLGTEFGAKVYATAGSAEKIAACLKAGATEAFNYHETDFAEALKQSTGGKGVNLVLDMVGGPYTQRNLRSLAMDGRLVQIAFMLGNKVEDFDMTPIMVKRLTFTGSTLRPRTAAQKAEIAAQLRQKVWPVLDAGRAGPVIHQVFPLAEAAAAHRMMESSAHIGKIMLRVAES